LTNRSFLQNVSKRGTGNGITPLKCKTLPQIV
jgi:hypothetical protein